MADRASITGAVTYHPGRDAAERYPDWVIRHRDLRGIPEVMDLKRRVILLDNAGPWATKRSSLAHAVAHLDLGHVVIGGHLGQRQESEAEQLAARRLVTCEALADAIRWHREPSWQAIAHELTVDERMLKTRLDHLHPSERHAIRAMLVHHQEAMTA